MARPLVMPQMGYDMKEGTILRWLKHEGEYVERGEPIAEIETDKVNIEIESFASGVILKLLAREGETIPVGQPIALIGEPGEKLAEEAVPAGATVGAAAAPAAPAAPSAPPGAAPGAPPEEEAPPPGERVRASPLVRRLAAEHGIDLTKIRGSGPGGRIVKEDILPLITAPRAPEAPPAPPPPAAAPAAPAVAPVAPPAPPPPGLPEFEVVELGRMRQTIARRMAESFQQAPHFFVTTVVEIDDLLALREQINAQVPEEERVSVTDLLIKACALALREHPTLNASFVAPNQLRVYKRIDINIAVATEHGLIAPFVPDADRKPLGEIARLTKDLIARAREEQLRPEEYQGGTFTISNLGMFGLVEHFTAIINPPQAAILAVGSILREPVYREGSDEPVPVRRLRLTLSVDHRVADGAAAARFLETVRHLLEHPMLLLVR
ncbi:dihydrolipoamide acetyltransferase family protein [Thermomicrobium sp. 4228-Ro]|uniref:dihydrolipoamide acetyltransferase family protein n=1 Tax=Thermomicrobium sp. 4228-Ro TaxID=2993937 RepID=UPI0022491858|nr:dihydrolipoamide acetyltransferase family protein [Thermomicrobium sp. 4228-Ro]MCX2726948.1 dihydrolipoamide acetyltransferase family protein [Thermomicrobium sp. 4228-Ro]